MIKKILGPYVHGTGRLKGRRYVQLIFSSGKKSTMLYSRYLIQKELGRQLSFDETVDHIDNDFTNDDLSNLQVITRKENAAKWHVDTNNIVEMKMYKCPTCDDEFEKDVRHVRHNRKQGKAGPFCSRSCAGKYKSM